MKKKSEVSEKVVEKKVVLKYELTFTLNGKTDIVKTNDVKEAIVSLKPEFPFTEAYITVRFGDVSRERMLGLQQVKKLFNDPEFLDVFIINLLLD